MQNDDGTFEIKRCKYIKVNETNIEFVQVILEEVQK